MKTSKIAIGTQVISPRFGNGVITKIITKSTGYVEVDYNGITKKEMAFNLTDMEGVALKSKPVSKPLTEEQMAKNERSIQRFRNEMSMAVLQDNFLDCQIQSGLYNTDLIQ